MPRAVDGTRRTRRRKKILKQTRGFYGRRSTLHKTAKDALKKSLQYAYRDRRTKKRDFRQLWIARISAALYTESISYSRFIAGLNKAGVALNRKILSNLAIFDPEVFQAIVQIAKKSLTNTSKKPKKLQNSEQISANSENVSTRTKPKKTSRRSTAVSEKAGVN